MCDWGVTEKILQKEGNFSMAHEGFQKSPFNKENVSKCGLENRRRNAK
jgi:hypothetical protein